PVKRLAAQARACCTQRPPCKAKTSFRAALRNKIAREAMHPVIEPAHEEANHGSMLAPGESSFEVLRRRPGVKRVPSPKLDLFIVDDFLPPDICTDLMALIDRDRRPSTIADANGDNYFRTSETCDLPADEPAVLKLEELLFRFNG